MQVTIVTPVYNGKNDILDLFYNIEELLTPDLKWLIVNDCSTDDTQSVLKKICSENKYINYINLENNSGPSIARYTGVKESSTDYVLFIDADDLFIKDSLVRFLDFCSKQYFDYYYAPLKSIHNKSDVKLLEKSISEEIRIIKKPTDFIRYGFPQPSSLLVSKSFFINNIKVDRLKWGEDFLLFIQLAKNGQGVRWSQVVSLYVVTGNGRGSLLSLKYRMNLSLLLFKESFHGRNKISGFVFSVYLTLRHVASYCYKRLFVK